MCVCVRMLINREVETLPDGISNPLLNEIIFFEQMCHEKHPCKIKLTAVTWVPLGEARCRISMNSCVSTGIWCCI